MAKDTLTIALNGEVSLDDFATAITCFKNIVRGLSREVAHAPSLPWTVVGLEPGSAIATVRGTTPANLESEHPVEAVSDAYLEVGRALQRRSVFPYPSVEAPSRTLAGLINGRISSIRFETEDEDAEIFGEELPAVVDEPLVRPIAYGSIRGRVQSLSNRGSLRFTLYDVTDDRAISCYLLPGMEDRMREAWGRVADVEGIVRRHPKTGRPATIREIEHIVILSEDQVGSWRDAIGCISVREDAGQPEETIRRLRDGN